MAVADTIIFDYVPAPPPLSSLRVLVVEDERRMREQLVAQVQAQGFRTLVATSAVEAIRIAEADRPEIIIIDGLLPNMHGFELARFLRALDSSYRPRLVLVTSIYKHVRYRNEAKLKYGIDAYLIKPVNDAMLAEVLS
jgi:DNA-binding response OmpR family regulator